MHILLIDLNNVYLPVMIDAAAHHNEQEQLMQCITLQDQCTTSAHDPEGFQRTRATALD